MLIWPLLLTWGTAQLKGLGPQTGLQRMSLGGRRPSSLTEICRCCFCKAATTIVMSIFGGTQFRSFAPSLTFNAFFWQGRELLSSPLQNAQHAWEAAVKNPCTGTVGLSYTGAQETETLHRLVTAVGQYQIRTVEWQRSPRISSTSRTAAHARSIPEAGGTHQGGSAGGAAGPPTVVFLHGFLGGPHDWSAVASALSLRCRCLAVELPGHGDSRAVGLQGRPHTPPTLIQSNAEGSISYSCTTCVQSLLNI